MLEGRDAILGDDEVDVALLEKLTLFALRDTYSASSGPRNVVTGQWRALASESVPEKMTMTPPKPRLRSSRASSPTHLPELLGEGGGEGGGAKRVSLPHRQCRAPTLSCRANPRAAPTPRHLVSWSYHTVTSQGRPNAAHCCRARLHPPSSRPRRPRQAPTRRTYSHAKSRRGRSPQKGARPEGGRTRSALRLSSARHCRRRARAKLGARRGGGRR